MLLSPLLLFLLTHTVFLRHLQDVRPYASWVFLFSGPLVEVFLSSTLRMVLLGGQSRCLSLWWDFSYVVWFRVFFLVLLWYILKFFLSSSLVWWFPLPIFTSIWKFHFLRAFWYFLDLVVLFLPSFVAFCFLSFTGHIFQCQIPSQYRHRISSFITTFYPYRHIFLCHCILHLVINFSF